ncbi:MULTISPECIES: HAD-IA family hydrolase [Sphingomonas]|jgi:putative hydrolase of the HAD superfamily|uniref:HAD family hydrolase n=1 Tax=Sphingomonas ginsenosidimutans TaxID=862134 RepID=A0A2A4HTD1_9SPHN|nr:MULTISPECIES: HAD-IA family hydrolase [Sphingomonas]MBY0302678.1 HAD-IA family hydrolase [Sphingomonas ginsenosidimutans]PCG07644.1 HAD family hydrolase [Sphingomonas ginsenosidimutans]
MRDTVIFDFGGVITSSPFEAFNRMERERGLPHDLVRRINATNPDDNAWARFERAEIDAAGFDSAFAEEARALGHELRGEDVLALLAGDIRPGMVHALDWLKREGYRIGCITNNVPAGEGAGMARTIEKAAAVAAVLERFDHVIESSKVGIRKPDPRIYTMMCQTLGVAPERCVYLDDLGINCKPAAGLGMIAIKVTGERQALDALCAALEIAPGHF